MRHGVRAVALNMVLGVALGGTLGNTAQAAGLDISLSDESAYLVFLTDSGSLGYGGADVGFGFLYDENENYLLSANIMVVGTLGDRRDWQFGVGAKAYAADLDVVDEDVLAIAIGGQARYVVQSRTPIGLVLEGYAAPGITSFGETKTVREVATRVEVEVLPSTRGYLGYRYIEVELEESGDIELDDNVHLGIRLQF